MKIKLIVDNKEIELTPEQIKILGDGVKKEKKGLWKPKKGDFYYTIAGTRIVSSLLLNDELWNDYHSDEDYYSIGNVYETKEEAETHLEKLKAIQRVKEYIAENCEVVEDVKNPYTAKYYVYYSLVCGIFSPAVWYVFLPYNPLPFLKTRKDAHKVIDNCKSDLKIILGIK